MQEAVKRYAEEIFRSHGVLVQIRVGLNSGEVVVRGIGSDLHVDYIALGHTTYLASRMAVAMDRLPPQHVETSVALWREINGVIGRYIRGLVM